MGREKALGTRMRLSFRCNFSWGTFVRSEPPLTKEVQENMWNQYHGVTCADALLFTTHVIGVCPALQKDNQENKKKPTNLCAPREFSNQCVGHV